MEGLYYNWQAHLSRNEKSKENVFASIKKNDQIKIIKALATVVSGLRDTWKVPAGESL